MTFAAPDPVPSGHELTVVAVRGRTPHSIEDFVGDAVFTVQWREQDMSVAGLGRMDEDCVRFHEKSIEEGGKDVRVWTVTTSKTAGQFVARTSR